MNTNNEIAVIMEGKPPIYCTGVEAIVLYDADLTYRRVKIEHIKQAFRTQKPEKSCATCGGYDNTTRHFCCGCYGLPVGDYSCWYPKKVPEPATLTGHIYFDESTHVDRLAALEKRISEIERRYKDEDMRRKAEEFAKARAYERAKEEGRI